MQNVRVISERRPTYGFTEELLRDVFRWSTALGAVGLWAGLAATGQAFRGNGFDEIVFGPAAVLLLVVAAVALPRALRSAEGDFIVPYIAGSAVAAGVASNIQMAWWLDVTVTVIAFSGLALLRTHLRQAATVGEPEEAKGDAADGDATDSAR